MCGRFFVTAFFVFYYIESSTYFGNIQARSNGIHERSFKGTFTREAVSDGIYQQYQVMERYLHFTDPQIRWKGCLTSQGYIEIGDLATKYNNYMNLKTSCFRKTCPSYLLCMATLLHVVYNIISLLSSCLIESEFLIYFFLIMSGIEQNPGPKNQEKIKQRVRKTGMQYKTYLTNRSSFEHAPTELRCAVRLDTNDCFENPSPGPSFIDSSNTSGLTNDIVINTDNSTASNNIFGKMAENQLHIHVPEYEMSDEEIPYPMSESSSESCSEYENPGLDSESDVEEPNVTDQMFEKDSYNNDYIYEGAQLTMGASILLLMTFAMTHNLTGEAFSDLIELIQLHCKEINMLPQSSYKLKQWFHDLKISPNKHYYCGECLISLENDCVECPNSKCTKTFVNKHDKCFFVEVSLIEQLKKLFAQNEFRKLLNNPFKKQPPKESIEDILDGHFYKSLMSKKKISPNDITFTWNTDGIPLFKSSKMSMWPFFLAINELPYKIRRKPENLLLVGLWIGPKKPEMLTFLKPFINDLQLIENGIEMPVDKGITKLIRGFLIAGTADLPAKCTVQNMTQFNGKYSCSHCLQPGETATSGKGIAHVFPFKYEGPTEQKRTHNESLQHAEIATNTKKTEYGIKGPCWFTHLQLYDFVHSNCIDYMHCVLLGITKRMISLWFSKEHTRKPYSYLTKIDIVNSRLSKLKPPLFVKRTPRSLSDLKYWKASEFRTFLLFYGPIVLIDVLTASHYSHFLLLSESIYLMLKESIRMQDLAIIENMIEHFVAMFGTLYEPRFMTLNLHLLLHLPENVRQQGPLWGYSCFPFEDANGFLMKIVKGTQSVHSQLIDTICTVHGLPYLQKQCIEPTSRAKELYQRMKNHSSKTSTFISENVYALGKIIVLDIQKISQDCYIALANLLNAEPAGTLHQFKRLKLHGQVFHSRDYTRVKARNSYTISYSTGNNFSYGIIHHFLVYETAQTNIKYTIAIITTLIENKNATFKFPFDSVIEEQQMKHFKIFHEPNFSDQTKAIFVQNIKQMCVYMKAVNFVVTCEPPNTVELE